MSTEVHVDMRKLCDNCSAIFQYQPGVPGQDFQTHDLRKLKHLKLFTWQQLMDAKETCSICRRNYAYFHSKCEEQRTVVLASTPIIATWWNFDITKDRFFFSLDDENKASIKLDRFMRQIVDKEDRFVDPLWTPAFRIPVQDRLSHLRRLRTECRETHKRCKVTDRGLPTRLIKLFKRSDGTFLLQLVHSKDVALPHPPYATLSYCWGTGDKGPTKTTRHNVAEHLKIIPWEGLNMTAQDAVQVAYGLGLSYIWIDSLCIIQGDHGDWEYEATRMSDVFGGSDLTIAAAGAIDAHAGLFLGSAEPCIAYETLPSGHNLSIRKEAEPFWNLAKSLRLYERGWVFQELVLSLKTVHFTQQHFYWQCQSRVVSEDNCQGLDGFYGPLNGFPTNRSGDVEWHDLASSYSRTKFTYKTDKLAALAGLTKWFTQQQKLTPYLGLWKETLSSDLAWHINYEDSSGPKRSSLSAVPSWSWLHWDAPVDFYDFTFYDEEDSYLSILDYQVTWSGEPMTSSVNKCTLTIEACLASVQVKSGVDVGKPPVPQIEEEDVLSIINFDEVGFIFTGTCTSESSSINIIMMQRGCTHKTERDRIYFLVVESVDSSSPRAVYKRIGIGEAFYLRSEGEPGFKRILDKFKPTILELV